MSAFLTINGIAVSVANGSASKTRDVVGAGITRAQSGAARNNFNAKKWHFKGKTTPIVANEALFLRALLDGMGDRWTFDADLYSDKGVNASVNTGGTIITTNPTPKYGASSLSLGSGTGIDSWAVDPTGSGANTNWTACFWKSVTGGAPAWHRFIVTIDSLATTTVYQDGSVSSLPAGLTVSMVTSGTVLQFGNTSGATIAIDDLLYVPAFCPASFVAGIDAFMQRQAWASPYPSLQLGGLATADDMHPLPLTVLGQPGDLAFVEGAISGSALVDNLCELTFDLIEV